MTVAGPALIRNMKVFEPFSERAQVFGMSYGLGYAGYDVRVEFDAEGTIEELAVPAGGFVLASTVERFRVPVGWVAIVHDKSSWARRGLAVQNTVAEPGWEGWLTLELTNHSKNTIILSRGMPIAQVILHRIECPNDGVGYDGKYQNQERGPRTAR